MNQPRQPKTVDMPSTTGDAMFAAGVARELAVMLVQAGVIDGTQLAARLRTQANMLERSALQAPVHPAAVETYASSMRELAATIEPATPP